MSTAHVIPHPASEFHSLTGTNFLIFGVSGDYAPQHREELHAVATSFGAAFADNCFVVHRLVFAQHADFAAELLTEVANHGLLP